MRDGDTQLTFPVPPHPHSSQTLILKHLSLSDVALLLNVTVKIVLLSCLHQLPVATARMESKVVSLENNCDHYDV